MLEILASSLTNILPSLTILHLSPKPVNVTFVNFAVSSLTSSTACTIATSIIHSKLDYCNSPYCKLPKSQLSRLPQIQNSLALVAPKSCHMTSILHSLHWLRITERIAYKLLSLTYKVLTTTQPPYIRNLISVQRPRSTRSSSVVTLARPPSSFSLFRLTYSFTHQFFLFWFTTLLIHYSLSFTPGLKPTCFTNPTPVV